MAKKVAYAVFKGRAPGVYDTWDEAERQVKGYKGSDRQGFTIAQGGHQAAVETFEDRIRSEQSKSGASVLVMKPGNAKSYGRAKPKKTWSMQPSLHDDVASLLEEDNLYFAFYEIDKPETSIRDYDTTVMGRFDCRNQSCSSNGWSSKKIAITVRLYANDRYNARVYHQRCMKCNSINEPILDATYAERVAYRLKKWSGIVMDQPRYSLKKSRGPHQSNLCEGCGAGHCSEQL